MEENNNLEKFFRDKFNQKIEPQDWNIPDSDVWDSIASGLPEKKNRRGLGLLPLLLMCAFLILSLILAYDNYVKKGNISELQKELIECSQQSNINTDQLKTPEKVDGGEVIIPDNVIDAETQSIHKTEPTTANPSEKSNINSELVPKNSREAGQLKSNNNSEINSSQNNGMKDDFEPINHSNVTINSAKKQKANAKKLQNQENPSINPTKSNNRVVQNSQNSLETSPEDPISEIITDNTPIEEETWGERNEFTDISTLPHLPFEVLHDSSSHFDIIQTMKMELSPQEKVSGTNIWMGPIIKYMNWRSVEMGSFDNPLSELLVNEQTAPSLAIGLGFNKKVGNRWVLNTGLLYYQRNHSSQYAINLPYSTADEINVGAEFENRFDHSLPTGLGSINTSLILARSINSPVTNNENVYLDFSLQNHSKALALPLTISYYLNRAGEGLFVQGGLMNELILENTIQKIHTESHHTFVRDKSIEVDYNTSQINRFNLRTILGIGYEKIIFKDISFSFSANYGFALNNTYSTGDYRHKINHFGVQIMVLKSIN